MLFEGLVHVAGQGQMRKGINEAGERAKLVKTKDKGCRMHPPHWQQELQSSRKRLGTEREKDLGPIIKLQ